MCIRSRESWRTSTARRSGRSAPISECSNAPGTAPDLAGLLLLCRLGGLFPGLMRNRNRSEIGADALGLGVDHHVADGARGDWADDSGGGIQVYIRTAGDLKAEGGRGAVLHWLARDPQRQVALDGMQPE